MGGDDLENDDQYLHFDLSEVEPDINEYNEEEFNLKTKRKNSTSEGKSKKRKASSLDDEDEANTNDKPFHKVKFLLETGRSIVDQSEEIQSAFLWSCYTHFLRDKDDASLVANDSIFKSSCFISSSLSSSSKPKQLSPMEYFLKNNVSSFKQMKKWKAPKSPMVLIVCLSARRAQAILKSLSSLNIRTAKLFAKHMDIDQQIAMLRNSSFGIAIGTPNRLCKLSSEPPTSAKESSPALSLKHTELLLIDCHEDHKRFTVCTLNDTAPDLMEFLKTAVYPQLNRTKKPLKLAFV